MVDRRWFFSPKLTTGEQQPWPNAAVPCEDVALRAMSLRERQFTTRSDLCRRLARLEFAPGRDTKGAATNPGPQAAKFSHPGPNKQHLAPFYGCSGSTMKVFWCPGVTWMFGVSVGRRWFWAGNSATAIRAAVPGVPLPLTPVASPIRWTQNPLVPPNTSLLVMHRS